MKTQIFCRPEMPALKRLLLLLSVLFFGLSACEQSLSQDYSYRVPEETGDGIETGSLEEARLNPVLIEEGTNAIRQGKYKEIHSLLIYRNDKLVLEEYFEGHPFRYDTLNLQGPLTLWDRDMVHNAMSVTKSVTSICIGIAVDKGFIKSADQSIFDYLPDYQRFRKDGKENITIENLLTMTSGLQWNEWQLPYVNPNNDVFMMGLVEDPVAFILDKPLIDKPGTSFRYAGGCNVLLGEILRNATLMNLNEFSGKYLFGPLEIDQYYWSEYRDGTIDAAGGLRITPRAMLKIGVTFLNNGKWKGDPIISEYWVGKSATSFPGNWDLNNWDDHWGLRGYGYSWWTHSFSRSGKRMDMFYAAGWGGQYIMVIPDLNAVIVFTEGNYTTYRPGFEILKKYIFPACQHL
jgi:hypothetical protein